MFDDFVPCLDIGLDLRSTAPMALGCVKIILNLNILCRYVRCIQLGFYC
jgi:hypothetical protein